MATTLENFLTRFAAGAGSQYRWELAPDGRLFAPLHVPDGLIPFSGNSGMCPLSAQATLETGKTFYSWDYIEASEVLNLDDSTFEIIPLSADHRYGPAEIRARLLAICGLEELPHAR